MKVKNRENHVNMATSRTAGPCANANECKRETRERERIRKERVGRKEKSKSKEGERV